MGGSRNFHQLGTWPRGYTTFFTNFILLISVKMPTIVGILTFISVINTTYERLKAINFFVCWYFSFMCSWNFVLSWVEHEKFITSGPGHVFWCFSFVFFYPGHQCISQRDALSTLEKQLLLRGPTASQGWSVPSISKEIKPLVILQGVRTSYHLLDPP